VPPDLRRQKHKGGAKLNFLTKIENVVEKCNRWLLVVIITEVSVLISLQVLLRYVFHLPLHFVEEILTLSAVWLYMLGNVNASREESHINARILEIFSEKPRYVAKVRMLAAILSIIVTIFLMYWSYQYMLYSIKKAKVSQIIGYPMIIMESSMIICMIPMFIYSVRDFFRYLNRLRAPEAAEQAEGGK
jgi:TRAP-type C4-dicarboxylate transport system permease small subunit